MCIVRNLRFKQSALKEKDSLYSIAERRVPVLGSPPAGDVSHKPGGRPAVRPTLATLKRVATNFAAW